MFHFPTFPLLALCVQARVTGHNSSGVSPFGHPRIKACLPAPRGLSQATTSFFGSYCQGIHHVLLKTCLTEIKDARVHCAVLKVRACPPSAGAYLETSRRFIRIQWSVQSVQLRTDLRLGVNPSPQDPTVCHAATTPEPHSSSPKAY